MTTDEAAREMAEAKNLLARFEQAATGWREIASAPRDGTRVLTGYWLSGLWVVTQIRWVDLSELATMFNALSSPNAEQMHAQTPYWGQDNGEEFPNPFCWMPLPPAPQGQTP